MFCTTASPWQQYSSFKIDASLGQWFLVECQIKVDCYATKWSLYWWGECSCYERKQKLTTRIWDMQYDWYSILIEVRLIGTRNLWIWKHFRHHIILLLHDGTLCENWNLQRNGGDLMISYEQNISLLLERQSGRNLICIWKTFWEEEVS